MPVILIGGGALLLILAAIFIYTSNGIATPAVPLLVRGAPAFPAKELVVLSNWVP